MKYKYIFIFIFLLLFFYSCSKTPDYTKPKIIFVHGFGGALRSSTFTDDMEKLFEEYSNFNPEIEIYSWDSSGIDNFKTSSISNLEKDNDRKKWKRAVNHVKNNESLNFLKYIEQLENKKQPYYIIGYSLGTKVVVESLSHRNNKLNMLKGIYFIGSAISREIKINKQALPNNFKIINFYSPTYDLVLKAAYRIAEFEEAGGETGFDDVNSFKNFETESSHSPSGSECNFLNMGYSIGYLIAIKEKLNITHTNCEISQNHSIKDRWNDLIYNPKEEVYYQQNSCFNSRRNFRKVEKHFIFPDKEKEKDCDLSALIKI